MQAAVRSHREVEEDHVAVPVRPGRRHRIERPLHEAMKASAQSRSAGAAPCPGPPLPDRNSSSRASRNAFSHTAPSSAASTADSRQPSSVDEKLTRRASSATGFSVRSLKVYVPRTRRS